MVSRNRLSIRVSEAHIGAFLHGVGASYRTVTPEQFLKHDRERELGHSLGRAIESGSFVILSVFTENEKIDHAVLLYSITVTNGQVTEMWVWDPATAKRKELRPEVMKEHRSDRRVYIIDGFRAPVKQKRIREKRIKEKKQK